MNNYKAIRVDGVVPSQYPEFEDAYLSYAEHSDGTPLTDEELERLNEEHPEIANQNAWEELI